MSSKQKKHNKGNVNKNTKKETIKIEDTVNHEDFIVLDGKKLGIIAVICLMVIGGGFYFWQSNSANTNTKAVADSSTTKQRNQKETTSTDTAKKDTTKQSSAPAKDLVIDTSTVTNKASFIKYDNNGEAMEIIAVKASDGSIRTAFNTCQVCYSSGRGYYKQEGNELVCQNCGNTFTADQVALTKGGCNPVPIATSERKEADGKITIPGTVMQKASNIFKNWKA